jgi:hypothetical protein
LIVLNIDDIILFFLFVYIVHCDAQVFILPFAYGNITTPRQFYQNKMRCQGRYVVVLVFNWHVVAG